MTPKPLPWERQNNEPENTWLAFRLYRDMESWKRNLRDAYVTYRTAKKMRQKWDGREIPGTFRSWSKRWRWLERAHAWDAEIDRQAREAIIAERVKASQRRAQTAVTLQRIGLHALRDKAKPDNDGVSGLVGEPASSLTSMIATGINIERKEAGEPDLFTTGPVTDVVRVTVGDGANPLRRLSDKELAQMEALTLKVLGEGEDA